MGILDEYPMGYFDVPIDPQPSFGMGGGLLAEPADTGFAQMAPFGGLLSGPAPAVAPAPARGGMFGGGGEPIDWRSMLMSAGAGLLKSNGRLEGLGDGIMSGMKMGQQNAGQRQMQQFRGLQMQKLQKEMAESDRLDTAWERNIAEAERIRNFAAVPPSPSIVAPTGPQFADVPAVEMPTIPDTPGFESRMPFLSGGAQTAPIEFGGTQAPGAAQAAAVQATAPKPSNPFVAALAALPGDQFGLVRGAGRPKGEVMALQFMNKENGDKFESVDPTTVGLPPNSVVQRNARSGKLDVISRGEAPRTITVNGRVHLQNRDGTPGQDIGSAGDGEPKLQEFNGGLYLKSDLLDWANARRNGGNPPMPPRQEQQATSGPAAGPRAPANLRKLQPDSIPQGLYGTNMGTPDDRLMSGVYFQESAGNPSARGPELVDKNGVPRDDRGVGIGQITRGANIDVARSLGRAPFTDAELSDEKTGKMVASTYMGMMLQKYGGNVPMALAAYNAGPGTVDGWTKKFGDPRLGETTNAQWVSRIPFQQTREYVPSVLAAMQRSGETTQTAGQGAAPVQTMPAPQRGGVQVAGNGPQPLMSVPTKEEPVAVIGPDGKGVYVTKQQAIGMEPHRSPREDKGFEHEKDLRHEFIKESKDFIGVRDSFNRILAANRKDPKGADDIALVYGFMKMLDPGSVVREGEFATAANAGGVPERVMNMYNKVINGEKLPPEVRSSFMEQARAQYQTAVQQHGEREGAYRTLAKEYGFKPERIVMDLSSTAGRERAKEELVAQQQAEAARQAALAQRQTPPAAAPAEPAGRTAPAGLPVYGAMAGFPQRQAPAPTPQGAVTVPIQAMGADGAMPPPVSPIGAAQAAKPDIAKFRSATGKDGQKIYHTGKEWIYSDGRLVEGQPGAAQ